jgi:hypothetical protein
MTNRREFPLPNEHSLNTTVSAVRLYPSSVQGAMMLSREPDPFKGLDQAEQDRLAKLYERLRQQLLDLTKKNRMLNYSLGARSKRHLQIIDEVPEEVYRLLVAEDASLEAVPLPEPADIPSMKELKISSRISNMRKFPILNILPA